MTISTGMEIGLWSILGSVTLGIWLCFNVMWKTLIIKTTSRIYIRIKVKSMHSTEIDVNVIFNMIIIINDSMEKHLENS